MKNLLLETLKYRQLYEYTNNLKLKGVKYHVSIIDNSIIIPTINKRLPIYFNYKTRKLTQGNKSISEKITVNNMISNILYYNVDVDNESIFNYYTEDKKVEIKDSLNKVTIGYGYVLSHRLPLKTYNRLKFEKRVLNINGKVTIVYKKFSKEELESLYGKISSENYGKYGGFKSITFGETVFTSKILSFNKKIGKFKTVDGKKILLQTFESIEEASKACRLTTKQIYRICSEKKQYKTLKTTSLEFI